MSRSRNNRQELQGHVITPQRQVILDAIRQSGGLLDAQELYKLVNSKDETISLATVYRSLNLFKHSGLLAEHRLGRSRCCYELKQSPEHQHMLCTDCGKIFEFESPLISQLVEQIRVEKEFLIDKVEVCIEGVCRECRQKKAAPN
jgi:Fur family transcriptional regulator, ferric uptake regulator